MDFQLDDEQQMLDDTVTRWVRDNYDFESREALRTTALGYSLANWAQFADMGLLGVSLSEQAGGFNGGGPSLMVVCRALGRGLVLEPYLANVALAGTLIDVLGDDGQKAEWIGALVNGSCRFALACHEAQGRHDPADIETTATVDGENYVLTGHKAVVLHGDSADQLVVVARSSGHNPGYDGLSAFVVDARADGVHRQGYPTIDGLRAAEITLRDVRVPRSALLGVEGLAGAALVTALNHGIVALCAQAAGAMQVACGKTLEYIKERKQFGVPIGSFQVLQHRMVDMHMALEKASSMAMLAACSLQARPALRDQRLAAAKVMIGKAGKYVAEEAIQLHGGMGMMAESAISHYAKRLIMIDHQLGDSNYHTRRFAAMQL